MHILAWEELEVRFLCGSMCVTASAESIWMTSELWELHLSPGQGVGTGPR